MPKFQDIQLAVSQNGGKEMIGLGIGLFGGRFAHRRILFEGLVVFFDFPPSLVSRCQLGLVQACIAAEQM